MLLGWPVVPAAAQPPFTLTLSGGAAVPVGSFERAEEDAGTRPDVAFGAQFTLTGSPWRSLYAGFSQIRFGCEEGGCPAGGDLVSTSWDLGVRFHLTRSRVSPWLQVGPVLLRVERKGDQGDGPEGTEAVSDLSVGGEVGAGVVVELGRRFALRPGVRYTLVNTRFDEDLLRMRYLVADLGLMLGF